MLLLNFSHPLTEEMVSQVEALSGQKISNAVALPVSFRNGEPYAQQLKDLLDSLPITSESLQTEKILINLPSMNFITAILLAELHGRMGYFPACLRIRSVPEAVPTRYEVAEILNLQKIREEARDRREVK